MVATLPVVAGMVSTAIFAGSVLPMLHKALHTREMSSYSFGHLALANVGNSVHSVYVFHLPPGPIWFLHSFYVVSSALMLYWYLRYRPSALEAGSRQQRGVDRRIRSGSAAVTARARFNEAADGAEAGLVDLVEATG